MPRFPDSSPSVRSIPGAVYSSLAHRLTSREGEVYPLHIGDTWLEPPPGCRMQDLRVEELPGMHRYAPVQGIPSLIDAVVARTAERTGIATASENVLITAGATGGLGAAVGAILAPGEEVLLLAPYWPLIAGIVQTFHGRAVPVPLFGVVDSPESAVEAVRRELSPQTVALYLNTPNNPTGRTIPRSWLEALVHWAETESLWLLADEVYEDYLYEGTHTYCRWLAPERTFSVHSFSKAFGMAGNRCGYVVGPADRMQELRKVSIHSFYSTPTASQIAAQRVLDGRGDAWVAAARQQYRGLGQDAARRLGVDPPQGSTFLFLDVAHRLDERGLPGFLEDCVERGLLVAPGPSFGPYPNHIRVCFTAAEPDVVRRGMQVLAGILER